MKVISLLQPFASLSVLGHKKIETRSWNTSYRGPLLIHASKGKYYGKALNLVSCRELCYQEPFNKYIGGGEYDNLPFGSIIGKVELVDTMQFGSNRSIEYFKSLDKNCLKEELAFGDYTEGR